jgi:hypothetical protein
MGFRKDGLGCAWETRDDFPLEEDLPLEDDRSWDDLPRECDRACLEGDSSFLPVSKSVGSPDLRRLPDFEEDFLRLDDETSLKRSSGISSFTNSGSA